MKRTILALLSASALTTTVLAARAERSDTSALPDGTVADRIRVDKSERMLTLFRGERELKTYKVALGRHPVGHKQQEGDGRTPEGQYKIIFHKKNSSFQRALRIGCVAVTNQEIEEIWRVVPDGAIVEITP